MTNKIEYYITIIVAYTVGNVQAYLPKHCIIGKIGHRHCFHLQAVGNYKQRVWCTSQQEQDKIEEANFEDCWYCTRNHVVSLQIVDMTVGVDLEVGREPAASLHRHSSRIWIPTQLKILTMKTFMRPIRNRLDRQLEISQHGYETITDVMVTEVGCQFGCHISCLSKEIPMP